MRLIEALRVFKPGMCVYRSGSAFSAIQVFHTHEALHAFLGGMSDNDFAATDWIAILGETTYGCFVADQPGNCRCISRALVAQSEKEKLPFSAAHLLTVLCRELETPDRRDVIVRELWLAMQLLATPESCADFIRRAVIIPA